MLTYRIISLGDVCVRSWKVLCYGSDNLLRKRFFSKKTSVAFKIEHALPSTDLSPVSFAINLNLNSWFVQTFKIENVFHLIGLFCFVLLFLKSVRARPEPRSRVRRSTV